MMSILKKRMLVTLVAMISVAAAGTLAGYFFGRSLSLRRAEGKLRQEAARLLVGVEAFSSESRAVLDAMNASSLPYCSDAEITLFRTLIFRSPYLKDGGRMSNGQIVCSAVVGRAGLPSTQLKAAYSQPDGTSLYNDISSLRVGETRGVILQQGGSYVVYAPHLLESLQVTPLHHILTSISNPHQRISSLGGSTKAFTQDGDLHLGDSLYVTRCTLKYSKCVSTSIAIPEALRADRILLILFSALGGLTGACLGLVFSLLYRRNRSMEHQLQRAIRRDRLRVVYQPIVQLGSGRIVGAEALARWTDEDGKPVGPDVFIKIAEARGFIGEITELVVRHVLKELGELLRSRPDFHVSVNVTAADLSDPKFLPMLDQALNRAEVPARSLAIEITEASTAQQEVAMEAIRQLRRRGHSVHIDDFGTGYSSLSYLHALSVDTIKIDRSFTQAVGTQAMVLGILPQILAMAEALNLGVVVEGIETCEQAEYFAATRQLVLAQGWLFGHPVPASDFCGLLSADAKKESGAEVEVEPFDQRLLRTA